MAGLHRVAGPSLTGWDPDKSAVLRSTRRLRSTPSCASSFSAESFLDLACGFSSRCFLVQLSELPEEVELEVFPRAPQSSFLLERADLSLLAGALHELELVGGAQRRSGSAAGLLVEEHGGVLGDVE